MKYSKTEAAIKILREKKQSMRLSEIIEIALDRKMISTTGKTPASTLSADIYLESQRKKKRKEALRFKRVSPGTYGLQEWYK